jgi:hypothetical protein
MDEFSYLNGRAAHYLELAREAKDPAMREALEAIAREFEARATHCDRLRDITIIDGVAPQL